MAIEIRLIIEVLFKFILPLRDSSRYLIHYRRGTITVTWSVALELPLGISLTVIKSKLDDQNLRNGVEKQWSKLGGKPERSSSKIILKRYTLFNLPTYHEKAKLKY